MEKSQSPIPRRGISFLPSPVGRWHGEAVTDEGDFREHTAPTSPTLIRPLWGHLPPGRGKAIPNLAKFYKTCYNIPGAWICAGAASIR